MGTHLPYDVDESWLSSNVDQTTEAGAPTRPLSFA
jgi:hypothetical protein